MFETCLQKTTTIPLKMCEICDGANPQDGQGRLGELERVLKKKKSFPRNGPLVPRQRHIGRGGQLLQLLPQAKDRSGRIEWVREIC
ncbi:hypothetical protein ElyMa_005918300 [Elysia marginata]|uniref:Uncharacterized protein n=1 Tax=Elysia marginata TaxID=1093978 RepID=A0AAV4G8A6_9GAST|nr:hypothetical protein ElyMa_005918300 [Elysia marginata]